VLDANLAGSSIPLICVYEHLSNSALAVLAAWNLFWALDQWLAGASIRHVEGPKVSTGDVSATSIAVALPAYSNGDSFSVRQKIWTTEAGSSSFCTLDRPR